MSVIESYIKHLFNNMRTKCICGLEHDWVEDFSAKELYDSVCTPMKCRRCGISGLYYERD